ncbi:hypothetical protein C8Q80DRAFT_1139976 [Daedaleopsis nitida]|nr:hypothetical protein C8Q80DRAFT_1139976 [Daedaleopsis nitida]
MIQDAAESSASVAKRSSSSPGPSQESTSPTFDSQRVIVLEEFSEPSLAGDHSSSSSQLSEGVQHSPLALDPSQPPTCRGNPRVRVYVACHECRMRRIRCDGAKPMCSSCKRRHTDPERCTYDTAPKRRGSDRTPGVRVRSAPGHRMARKSQCNTQRLCSSGGDERRNDTGRPSEHTQARSRLNFEDILCGYDPLEFDPHAVDSYRLSTPLPIDQSRDEDMDTDSEPTTVGSQPTMHFARDTWWESLLMLYSRDDFVGCCSLGSLTADLRSAATKRIFLGLRASMSVSIQWANFVHPPRLFETVLSPTRRKFIQPSLLLSMLAFGALVEGSELKEGAKARRRAVKLVELAHAALQASLSCNWVDIGLVQAAWFIACFEFQGHPDQSWSRRRSALVLLDSMIRLLALTSIDAGLPQAKYSIFQTFSQEHPAGSPSPDTGQDVSAHSNPGSAETSTPASSGGCRCNEYMLRKQWPTISQVAPLWGVVSMWPLDMSEAEVLKEECRRTVWSSVILCAGHYCVTSDHPGEPVDLTIMDYRKLSLLFPGEVLSRSGVVPIRQDNVWNLCIRAKMLWQTSIRYRFDRSVRSDDRVHFVTNAWLEADAIDAALGKHTCNVDNDLLWQARDALSMTKMYVSFEVKQYIPEVTTEGTRDFYREKILGWLSKLIDVGKWLWQRLQVDDDTRRPIFKCWLLAQMIRTLQCYESDPTLLAALEACKALATPMEYLMRLWPCQEQRDAWQHYRYRLVEACLEAGVATPTAWVPPITAVDTKDGSSTSSVAPVNMPSA